APRMPMQDHAGKTLYWRADRLMAGYKPQLPVFSTRAIEEIVHRLVRATHPVKIVPFGSRARGANHADSDSDPLVIAESEFHCQQAAEKALKAYLIEKQRPFPLVHDLSKLLEHCVKIDASFRSQSARAVSLNPFAVTTRYDENFWPDAEAVKQAIEAARGIY